ncbi:MAG: DUF465 domain-containing protein [Pseudomonadota bacterium]
MEEQEQAHIKMQAARLKLEHDDMHAAIEAMVTCRCDALQIQRMKKKKLEIKDRLEKLNSRIIPDIIA